MCKRGVRLNVVWHESWTLANRKGSWLQRILADPFKVRAFAVKRHDKVISTSEQKKNINKLSLKINWACAHVFVIHFNWVIFYSIYLLIIIFYFFTLSWLRQLTTLFDDTVLRHLTQSLISVVQDGLVVLERCCRCRTFCLSSCSVLSSTA